MGDLERSCVWIAACESVRKVVIYQVMI